MFKKAAFTLCTALLLALPALTAYAAGDTDDSGLLWLVNKSHSVASSYVPPNLTSVEGSYKLRSEAVTAYKRMLDAMKADGITGLRVNSAYRTYADQRYLFNNMITRVIQAGTAEAEAAEKASWTVARPGTSEHQLGLAVDVTTNGRLTQAFAKTEASRWIEANGYRFGFIVRYPEDKTSITRVIYEPWHLRYVGMPHSAFMRENGLCFEEYIDYLMERRHYVYREGETCHAVLYLDEAPDPNEFQDVIDISAVEPGEGGGYVVTLKKVLPFYQIINGQTASGMPRNDTIYAFRAE